MNELTSRNSRKSTNILEIKVDDKIVSNPMDIAETINDHFTNVAQVLAQYIAVVDFNPESYLEPTDHPFSPQIPRVDIVSNILLKIDEKKPPVLILFRLNCLQWLLVSSQPLLPQYSQSRFSQGYIRSENSQNDWKTA